MPYHELASGGLAAFLATFFIIILLVFIAIYVYSAIVLMTIAKKTKTKNGWLAWIPIANIYLMTQIAKVPWWYMLAFLLGIIPIIGFLIILVVHTFLWWKICEARGKPGWLSLLMFIPLVNLVIMGVVAWKD